MVRGVKWNPHYGARPDSITVYLRAGGALAASRTVTASDGWKWKFEDLPRYEGGNELSYMLTEREVEEEKTVDQPESSLGMQVITGAERGREQ